MSGLSIVCLWVGLAAIPWWDPVTNGRLERRIAARALALVEARVAAASPPLVVPAWDAEMRAALMDRYNRALRCWAMFEAHGEHVLAAPRRREAEECLARLNGPPPQTEPDDRVD